MSLHPEMRRESLRNFTEDQAKILGKMELQTPEIDYDLTQEQLNNLLGKSDKPTEIMLIPPDFEITEINTDLGTFSELNNERIIAWCPAGPKGKPEIALTSDRWMQLAEMIPTMLNVLNRTKPKGIALQEDNLEPDPWET